MNDKHTNLNLTSSAAFRPQHSDASLVDTERDLSYESAIRSLNALQSNAATLQKIRKERQKHVHLNLPLTRLYLERSGVTQKMLNSLKTIHVSGTKGKGSTCAFCESILRQHGLRTGFYSSPHLVSATERVRLNGDPVTRQKFTKYFWQVYDKVCRGRSSEDRPPYFQFLTVLAFNIFIKENVDVAIIEVGIGGEYDCTNIIQNPVVTGMTALGLDHTNILGNTLADIAWHKAGIMKVDSPMFIDGEQPLEALKVISARSRELNPSLLAQIPTLNEFDWGKYPMLLGLHGQVQNRNAALALTLAKTFLNVWKGEDDSPKVATDQDHEIDAVVPFKITGKMALGLRITDWPGRTQILEMGRMQYFLDGAHTEESTVACASWFNKASVKAVNDKHKVFKVMIFNTSGERDPRVLMTPFLTSHLDLVIFTTNVSGLEDAVDQENFTTTDQIQLARCKTHIQVWTKLNSENLNLRDEEEKVHLPRVRGENAPCVVIPLIKDALLWLDDQYSSQENKSCIHIPDIPLPPELLQAHKIQVLVTGSLHLVGGVTACLQEDERYPQRKGKVAEDLLRIYEDQDHLNDNLPGKNV